VDSLSALASKLYAEGNYREAIRLGGAVAGDTTNGRLAFALGASYAALNDFQNAQTYLERAVSLRPRETGYRFHLARLLVQLSMAGEAADHYEAILDQDSTFLPALYQLGLLMYERREHARAAGYFLRIIRINPRDFLSQYYLGACYATLERPDSARYVLSACVTLQPSYTPAVALLASLYFARGEYAQSLRLYTRASRLRPDNADLLYRKGLCQEKLSDYREAIGAFRSATVLDTAHVHAYAHLGQSYFQMGKYDSAIAAYEEAVRLEEDNPSFLVNIALAWERRDSIERAAASFERAVRACQPDQIARLYAQLAALRFNAKQYREAKETYRRALQIDPSSLTARFFLAVTHDQLKEYDRARDAYRLFIRQAGADTTFVEKVRTAKHRMDVLQRRH
jgi:tetratricopeptide (TPR) repeat protein